PAVRGYASQRGPKLAATGSRVLLAWQSGGIYGLPLPNLPQQDQDPFKFEIAQTADDTGWPSNANLGLGAGTSQFLAAWAQNGRIFATRIDAVTFQPISTTPLQVSP